jgi:Fe-S-cluster containining protein
MAMQEAGSEVEVRFRLRIGGAPWDGVARVPNGPAKVSALLPTIGRLADRVVERAREGVEASGRTVSCGPGCGACCRQPVPIAVSEAHRLVALIRAWPAPRRRAVEARFDAARERLDAAGLLEPLRALGDLEGVDARQALGRAYFDLGIDCPFLEDESCSIHAERPIACREYLVTSEPARCADPTPERVDLVPLPVRPSVALFRMTAEGPGEAAEPVLLVLAREVVDAGEAYETATTPGPALLEGYVRSLSGASG